jgi:hypothetical protein
MQLTFETRKRSGSSSSYTSATILSGTYIHISDHNYAKFLKEMGESINYFI